VARHVWPFLTARGDKAAALANGFGPSRKHTPRCTDEAASRLRSTR